jgi:hypothetical protein
MKTPSILRAELREIVIGITRTEIVSNSVGLQSPFVARSK